METRLKIMDRAFLEMFEDDCGNTAYPEHVLVWIHYVRTGKLRLDGVGSLNGRFVERLANEEARTDGV